MLNALPAPPISRRIAAMLLVALVSATLIAGFTAASAPAQTLVAPPQTKEEVAKQKEEAEKAAADNSGGSVPLEVWLAIAGVLIIGGATAYMLRDSRAAVGGDPRRAPSRQPLPRESVRGAPRTMFEGETGPGGKVGRNKKREKTKRQKQARRNNRPGR